MVVLPESEVFIEISEVWCSAREREFVSELLAKVYRSIDLYQDLSRYFFDRQDTDIG